MKAYIFFTFLLLFACKTQNPGKQHYSKSNQTNMDNYSDSIAITGIANNAKLGAIILTDNKEIYYIEGIDYWPHEVVGKKVKANGFLKKEYFNEVDLMNKKGEYKQGMSGEKLSLQNAIWEIIPEKE